VAAHSRLVAALGRDIAAALKGVRLSQAAEASAGDPPRSEVRRWPWHLWRGPFFRRK